MIHNGGLTWWLSGKESACQRTRHKRHVFDAWVGSHQSSGEGNDDPFQYSCLDNPMDRETWWATVHWGPQRVRHNLVTKQ